MKIEKANKKNLREIAEIFRIESGKEPYFQIWTEKKALMKIKQFFNKDDIYVALLEGKIIGFIIAYSYRSVDNKKKGFIEEMWFDEKHQGKGYGSALMKYVETKYKKNGVEIIQLAAKRKANFMIKKDIKKARILFFWRRN